ncbi:MAG TPA: dihydroneopterin aldolase [Candidatus Coprousia avicola]|nr:dihydroneopterin aldolase [Candidatus Coprousia avicola]
MTDKHLPEDTSRGEETTLVQRDRAGLPVARRELAKLDPAALEHADKILIEGLEVFANHGVYPAENELGQKFVVSATLYTSLRQAGKTDDLDASINYGEVCHTIDAYLRAHTFKLIEAAAEATTERLLADYPALIAVRLRIAKPWAPIGLPLSSVAVEIERTR